MPNLRWPSWAMIIATIIAVLQYYLIQESAAQDHLACSLGQSGSYTIANCWNSVAQNQASRAGSAFALYAVVMIILTVFWFAQRSDSSAGSPTLATPVWMSPQSGRAPERVSAPAPLPTSARGAAAVSRTFEGHAAGAGATTGMKKCPDCAEEVRAEARICRYCRYEFPPSPVEELPLAGDPPPVENQVEPLGRWYVVTSTLAGLAAGGLVLLEYVGGSVRLSSQHSGVTLSAFSAREAPWAGTSTSVLRLWTSDGEVTLQPVDDQNVRESMARLAEAD